MSAPATRTFWNIPYQRNPFFTGRNELLAQLRLALGAENAVALSHPQGINGLGGIGKTQIALEYAYRYRTEYTAVFWVHADSIQTLHASLIEIAQLLELSEKDAQSESVIAEAVWRWLRQHNQWLLIFDNMDNLTLTERFLPKTGPGHILFTTRAHALGGIAERLEVPVMEPETGALLLLRRATILPLHAKLDKATYREHDIACKISREIGGLPLALDQAGAYIKMTQCTLEDYLSLYQTRRLELLQTRGPHAEDYPASVATTWSLSFEKVAQANLASAELLKLCAFLSPDAIPETILITGSPYFGDVLASVTANPFRLDLAFKEALNFSLIAREADEQTITVHRLVQAVIRDGMDREKQYIWVERVMQALNSALPDTDAAAQHELRIYLPHMLMCNTFIKDWGIKTADAKALLGGLICCAYRINDSLSGIQFANQALEIYPQDASLYIWRGIAYKILRDYPRALESMNSALELDPNSAWAYTHRAALHMERKDYQHALGDMSSAVSIDPDNVGVRVHRALAYVCVKDYQHALDDLDIAVALEPLNAWVRTHRARLYGRLNDYSSAFDDMKVAFSIDAHNAFMYIHRALLYIEIKDDQHALGDLNNAVFFDPKGAWVHGHRARFYRRMRDYTHALEDANRAIMLEPTNPWVYVQRALLVYQDIKEYQKALQDLNKALELGPANAEYLVYRAIIHRENGDNRTALQDLDLALTIDDHEAQGYIERAILYKMLGEYRKAIYDLNCAEAITPDDTRIYAERSVVYTLIGDIQQAQVDTDHAYELALQKGSQIKEPW